MRSHSEQDDDADSPRFEDFHKEGLRARGSRQQDCGAGGLVPMSTFEALAARVVQLEQRDAEKDREIMSLKTSCERRHISEDDVTRDDDDDGKYDDCIEVVAPTRPMSARSRSPLRVNNAWSSSEMDGMDVIDSDEESDLRFTGRSERTPATSPPVQLQAQESLQSAASYILSVAKTTDPAVFNRPFAKGELPLYTHVKEVWGSRGVVEYTNYYFVWASGAPPKHLGAAIHKTGRLPFTKEDTFEQRFLEMKTTFREPPPEPPVATTSSRRRAASANNSSFAAPQALQRPPRYVLEVGEIYIRRWEGADTTGDSNVRSTNCHMVMDVTTEAAPLWLVYRYRGVEKGVALTRNRSFDRDTDMWEFLGPGGMGSAVFDVAKIADSIDDWIRPGGVINAPIHNLEGLMKTTRFRGHPVFLRPDFREFVQQEEDLDGSAASSGSTVTR